MSSLRKKKFTPWQREARNSRPYSSFNFLYNPSYICMLGVFSIHRDYSNLVHLKLNISLKLLIHWRHIISIVSDLSSSCLSNLIHHSQLATLIVSLKSGSYISSADVLAVIGICLGHYNSLQQTVSQCPLSFCY